MIRTNVLIQPGDRWGLRMVASVRIRRTASSGDGWIAGALLNGRLGISLSRLAAELLSDGVVVDHARRHIENGERVFVCGERCPYWGA